MTDPKIRVSADVSAVQSELAKVNAAAAKINQTLNSGQVGIDAKEAKADLASLESSATKLVNLLEKAKGSGENFAGVDFDSVTGALEDATKAANALDQVLAAVGQSSGMSQTVQNAKQVADHITRAGKAQELLGREGIKLTRQQAEEAKKLYDRWRKSGARGTSRIKGTEFDDWLSGGWRDYSIDQDDAKRQRDRILESVGISPGTNRHERRAAMVGRMGAAAGALGGIAGGMMNGGDGGMWGNVGSGVGSLAGVGAGMMFGGPVGAVVGAFASRFLGGVGGGADSILGNIGGEGSDITDLRRMMGATSIDFEQLRGSIRYFSEGLGLTYNESAKLARSFEHTAGILNENIGKEVGSAAGFARGYGMSPEAAVQFFANMRHFGLSGGDQDNRKMAVNIAEAVARGGTSAKMDEVLGAIQGFVQNSTRTSMTAANAEAYASFMSSLTGLSMNGMKGDVTAATGAMGAADAALRQGGAYGEASKNFSLGLYQNMLPGFTALDQKVINEQGAFGSISRAFGENSPAYLMAQSQGDTSLMNKYREWTKSGGDRSILSLQMDAIERMYGGDTRQFSEAIQTHLGVSPSQASALLQAHRSDRGLGGLQEVLSGAGVDVGKLNTRQIASMAELASANDSGIRRQAFGLMGLKGNDALSKSESEALNKAIGANDPEALRKMVISLSALHDTTKDQGDDMRKQQANMANAMQELVTNLVPLTMAIKDGIVELVRKFTPDSQFVKDQDAAKVAQKANEDRATSLDSKISDIDRQIKGFKATSPAEASSDQQALASMKRMRDDAARRGDTKGVEGFDHNIALMEKNIRARSAQGLQDLIDQRNTYAAERNSIPGVRGSAAMMDSSGTSVAPATGGSARKARAGMSLSQEELAYLAETDRLIGAKAGTSAAQIQVESGNDPNAVSPRGAMGLAQLMPKTKAELERRLGRPIATRQDQLLAHRMLMQENVQQFGSVEDALRAYNGGWDRGKWLNGETQRYVPSIDATRDEITRKAPAGENPGIQVANQSPQTVRIDGRFTLYDQNGNERSNSSVQTSVGSPRPMGTSGMATP